MCGDKGEYAKQKHVFLWAFLSDTVSYKNSFMLILFYVMSYYSFGPVYFNVAIRNKNHISL